MGLETYLEERLVQIVIEREEVSVRLDEIRARMKRADDKRAGQENTPNYNKWTSILRGLEHELDKHEAMLETLEAESQKKSARLIRARNERESKLEELKAKYETISAMTSVELQSLSTADKEAFDEYERLMAEKEAANGSVQPEAPINPSSLPATADAEIPENVRLSDSQPPDAQPARPKPAPSIAPDPFPVTPIPAKSPDVVSHEEADPEPDAESPPDPAVRPMAEILTSSTSLPPQSEAPPPPDPTTQLEPMQPEPVQAEPVQAEPVQAEPVQAEPTQPEPTRAEPVQAEPAQPEPAQLEPVQAEPAQPAPAQLEPVQAEPTQPAPAQPAPAQPAPAQPAPAQPEPAQPKPARVVSSRVAPLPTAASLAGTSPAESTDAKTRRKQAFHSALEKSRRGAISALTFEEVAILLAAYRKLALHPDDKSKAAKLEANVSGAMWEVHAHCARICANWADIVRRDAGSKR